MYALSMSTRDMAKALRLGPRGSVEVERWLSGKRPIPGPAQIAVEAMVRERHGPVLDIPDHDPDVFDGADHTAHRALYASILDNVDRPEAVKALTERWWEGERQMLQALIDEPQRLNGNQYVLVMRAIGA